MGCSTVGETAAAAIVWMRPCLNASQHYPKTPRAFLGVRRPARRGRRRPRYAAGPARPLSRGARRDRTWGGTRVEVLEADLDDSRSSTRSAPGALTPSRSAFAHRFGALDPPVRPA